MPINPFSCPMPNNCHIPIVSCPLCPTIIIPMSIMLCVYTASTSYCCVPILPHAHYHIYIFPSAIWHHAQVSLCHVVPGLWYSMTTFSQAYITHAHYALCLFCPMPVAPIHLMSMLIKPRAHHVSCLFAPCQYTSCCSKHIMSHAHDAICP